jgi:flagellar protein FlgJ
MVRNISNYLGTPESQQAKGENHRRLHKACVEFESMLLYEIVKSMRRTISKCDLFHGGMAEETYEQLLDQELCRSLGGQRGLGIAETLYQQLRGSLGPTHDK